MIITIIIAIESVYSLINFYVPKLSFLVRVYSGCE